MLTRRILRKRSRSSVHLFVLLSLTLFATFGSTPPATAAPDRPAARTTLPSLAVPPVRFAAPALHPGAAATAAATAPNVGRNVDASNLTGAQSETSVAIDPKNPQVLVAGSNDVANLHMDAYSPTDGGLEWTAHAMPLTDANPLDGVAAFASDPSVAGAADGTFYYSYILINGSDASVVVSRSTDGGQTWSTPAVVADGLATGVLDDKQLLAVDNWTTSPNNGSLYDVWTYNTDVQNGASDQQIVEISMSTDGGLHWSSQPVAVSPASQTSVLYAQAQVAPDGSVYVVWDDYGSRWSPTPGQSRSVIRAAHCTVAGGTLSCTQLPQVATTNVNLASQGPYTGPGACSGTDEQAPQPSDCYAIPPQPDRGIGAVPTLAVGPRGSVYVAWTDAPSPAAGSTFIDFSRWSAGAGAWSAPATISAPPGGSYDFLPWLTIDPLTGTLAATFYSTRGDPANQRADVYLVQSTDGGATWSAPERVSSQPSDEGAGATGADLNNYGDYEGVAALGGTAHAVWTDTRDAASLGEEVFTAAVTLSTAASVSVAATPGYATAGGTAPLAVSGAVYDAAGQPVPGVTVDLSATAGSLQPAEVTTGPSGAYQSALVPPAAAGSVTVTANVYGAPTPVAADAVVLVAPAAASVTGSASGEQSAQLPAAGLSVVGSGGTGVVRISAYGSDPVSGTPSFAVEGGYFDVALSSGSGFTQLLLSRCGLSAPASIYWWDPLTGAWTLATDQSYSASAGCVYLTIGPGTGPTLADLTGTAFVVGTSPETLAAGDTLGFGPSPIASPHSLTAGETVSAVVYARDATGAPLGGAEVYLSFVSAAGGGSASVGGTALSGVAAGFQTDSAGRIAVVYTAPANLPASGTDTLTAASDASSSPAVQATDTYAFAATLGGGGGGGGGGGVGGPPPPPPAPAVEGIQPSGGPAAGGTVVTVTGSGFNGATSVDFGSAPATSFKVLWDARLTAVAPAGSGTVDVTVTTAAGTSSAVPADRFTYAGGPPAAAPTPAIRFSDVPAGFWALPYIQKLVAKGIASGFPNGTFGPDEPVTRAQFVKLLVLTMRLKPGSGSTGFTDVPAGAWFAPYVSAATQAGLVKGVEPGSFDPDGVITREQMAVLLARAMAAGGNGVAASGQPAATPKDISQVAPWARGDVGDVLRAGLMNGFPDGTFRPLAQTTRAQAAAVLVRLLGLLGQG